ncbi:MAG: DUF3107 domain-containing protein [Actinomycetia bacterium]|nr:DUF3107 domain-containing protein [Actinomycetes bacterium]
MEVKIGVTGAARELVLESPLTADELTAAVRAALAEDHGVLVLTDDRGRQVLVPTEKLAFVEVGEPVERRVGFGAM